MTNITYQQGLGFISPRPRASLDSTITPRALAATKKEQKTEHTCIKALKNELHYIHNDKQKTLTQPAKNATLTQLG